MSKDVTMKLSGFDALERSLERIYSEIDGEVDALIEEEAQALKEEAQQLAPFETGELHDSAFVHIERTGDRVEAQIGFDAEHALYQHENPEQPKWKFLEGPFLQRRDEMLKRISNRVASAIRKK